MKKLYFKFKKLIQTKINTKPVEKTDGEIRKGPTVSKIDDDFFIKELNGIYF